MKIRALVLLLMLPLAANAAVSQMNALSWCRADGTDQTANMQRAVNAAVAAGQPLYVPPGIVFTYASLTNTETLLMEDYAAETGAKTYRGTLSVSPPPGVAVTNNWGDENVTQKAEGKFYGQSFVDACNVLYYGATANDSSDDTAAFEAAIAANVAGQTIIVPDGVYIISELEIPKSLNFSGTGTIKRNPAANRSTIVIGDASDGATLNGVNGGTDYVTVKFSGLTFDGNRANCQAVDLAGWQHYGALIYSVNGYKSLEVEGCTFTNATRIAIYAAGPNQISRSIFVNQSPHQGVYNRTPLGAIFGFPVATSPTDRPICSTVTECVFIGTSLEDDELRNNSGAIFFTDNAGKVFDSLHVAKCVFWGTSLAREDIGNEQGAVDTYNGVASVVCEGNEFYKCTYSAMKIQRADNARLTGNFIKHSRAYGSGAPVYAILYDAQAREGSAPFTGARLGETHYNSVISDNVISDWEYTGIRVSNGGERTIVANNVIEDGVQGLLNLCRAILCQNGKVTVANNIIRETVGMGIQLIGAYTDGIVTGNQILAHTSVNAPADGYGICFGSGWSGGLVANNRVALRGQTAPAIYITSSSKIRVLNNHTTGGLNGIRMDGTSADVDVLFNRFDDSSVAYVNMASGLGNCAIGNSVDDATPVWNGSLGNQTSLTIASGANPATMIIRADAGVTARTYYQSGTDNAWAAGRDADGFYRLYRYIGGVQSGAPIVISPTTGKATLEGVNVTGSGGGPTITDSTITATNIWALLSLAVTAADTNANLMLRAPAGYSKNIAIQSDLENRWVVGASETAESGANAGSDFRIRRYDDDNNSLGDPLTIARATGKVTLGHALDVSGYATFGGGLNIGSYVTDPAAPSNGDVWYNATEHQFRGRTNGVTVIFSVTPVVP